MNFSQDGFAAIAALDLDPIKVKLMHKESGEGWTRSQADAVEFEYRRFLYLMKKYPTELAAPNVDVDIFWHYHILDTMKYAQDCQAVFGYFLHHFPYVGLRDEEDLETHHRVGERMQVLYEETFGQQYVRDVLTQAQGGSALTPATAFSMATAPASSATAFSMATTPASSRTAFSMATTPASSAVAFSMATTPASSATAFSMATPASSSTAFSMASPSSSATAFSMASPSSSATAFSMATPASSGTAFSMATAPAASMNAHGDTAFSMVPTGAAVSHDLLPRIFSVRPTLPALAS